MRSLSMVVAAVFGFAAAAIAQTKVDSVDASGADWADLHCAKSAGEVSCFVVLRPLVSSSNEELVCRSPTRTLRAPNANRIDTVATALIPSALRAARFDVDAGSP